MPENPDQVSGGAPELPVTSESEQMYLITVARAVEEGAVGPMPMAALASGLGVSAASANEMVRKLADRELVTYAPYRGVELTATGRRLAERVLRTRRLWATFMAERLGFSAREADGLACQLEHVTPPDAAERLAAYLGNPRSGPLGKPIPQVGGSIPVTATTPLSGAVVGSLVEVVAVTGPPAAVEFLTAEALVPGAVVRVRAAGSSGVLVDAAGRWAHVAHDIAEHVGVVEASRHAVG